MNAITGLVRIDCPYCHSAEFRPWAKEIGYDVVRCAECDLLYVNPAPAPETISEAVKSGMHGAEAGNLDVRSRRVPGKVDHYHRMFGRLFPDLWSRKEPFHWLDVGAGYGEVIEAIGRLSPAGSVIEGVEPMTPKAELARSRGLLVTNDYLRRDHAPVDIVSSIDVFSHIPDYRAFIGDVVAVLKPGGEMVIVTGNLADVADRSEFPDELGTPDHLVFAGKKHIVGLLEEAGFGIVAIDEQRTDTLLNFAKTCAKRMLGRPGVIRLPYTSSYRQLVVRAKLKA